MKQTSPRTLCVVRSCRLGSDVIVWRIRCNCHYSRPADIISVPHVGWEIGDGIDRVGRSPNARVPERNHQIDRR
jgi:hypothetical protein